jgi:uncharacterized membrane protein
MNKINFISGSAQRIYDDYMRRVGKSIAILGEADKTELVMELNSHIYEAMLKGSSGNEVDCLLDVIAGLGVPEEFLKPLVAGKKLDQAVRSFNPKHVFQAISLNLRSGIIYTFFGLLYLFLVSFILLIAAKIIFPANTGLFFSGSSFRAFGFMMDTDGLTEVLGYWLIPLSIITALFCYTCITLLLRLKRKR